MTDAPPATACWPGPTCSSTTIAPATAGRLGLGTDALRERHPRLVVASVGGFAGADADRPAYDLLAQAVSGLMSVTGEPVGAADEGRGCAARSHRGARVRGGGARGARRPGSRPIGERQPRRGRRDLADQRARRVPRHGRRAGAPRQRAPEHRAVPGLRRARRAPRRGGRERRAVRAAAGRARSDRCGRSVRHERARVAAREELAAWLGAAIASVGAGCPGGLRSAADVPAGPVNSVPEALAAMGEGWVGELDGVRLAPGPLRVEGQLTPLRRPPPRLGEHTDEVLRPSGEELERETGIEPATCGLEGRRSAN